MKLPKVSLIIVNYNRKKLIENCLKSVFNLDYPQTKLEVIVVDNNSSDGSVEYINKEFDNVKLVKNKENNYCKANNLGIKKAKGEYIAFVNNDVELEKNWLIKLIKHLEDKTDIAGAMGKVLFKDGLIQSTGHYGLPNFYWGDKGFKEKDKGQFDKIEKIKSIPNIASLYCRDVFNEVGFFDEDFQMYIEDIDMGIRCQKKGFNFLYIPNAICYHKFHGTAKESFLRHQIEKNRLLFIVKHFPYKLPESLYGKGYFQFEVDGGENEDIVDIISLVFSKLLQHNSPKVFNELFPAVLKEIYRYYSNEKYYLIQHIRNLEHDFETTQREFKKANIDIDKKNEEILNSSKLISFKDGELAEIKEKIREFKEEFSKIDTKNKMEIKAKNEHLLNLQKAIGELQYKLQEKHVVCENYKKELQNFKAIVASRNSEIKDLESIISEQKEEKKYLDHIICEKEEKLKYFYEWSEKFYKSQTYKLILKPLWFFIDIPKKIFKLGRFSYKRYTIVKSNEVSYSVVKRLIKHLRNKDRKNEIKLVDFSEPKEENAEGDLLQINAKVKFQYQRGIFNIFALMKLFYFLIIKGSDRTYLVLGNNLNKKYRKLKLFTLFLRTNNILLYLSDGTVMNYPPLFKLIFLFILRSISLYFLVLFFFLFIELPYKILISYRKLFIPRR